MKIHLHVGVHKTATTYMQRRLTHNRLALTQANIAYMPLMAFRAYLTSRLMALVPGELNIQDHSHQFFADARARKIDRLIISDENLVGGCAGLLDSGIAFRSGAERLERLRRLFPDADITLFCAVRSYDTFLSSAYCEALRNRKSFVQFQRFQDRVELDLLRWPGVVERFAAAIQPSQVRIWRYEDFRPNAMNILRELAFGADLSNVAEDATERPSFSQIAIELLDLIAARKGRKIASQLIGPIGDSLPKSDGYAQFDPWSDAERARLVELYATDCASIDAQHWLLAPQKT